MAKIKLTARLRGLLDETDLANPLGACLLEGCRSGARYFGLCEDHFRTGVEKGAVEAPKAVSPEKCAVRWHTAEPARGESFCPDHLALFATMKGGALSRLVDQTNAFKEVDLPLDSLHPGWTSMRPDLQAEDVVDLAGTLGTFGQFQAILATPDPEGWMIVDGVHRWLAMKQVPGATTIRARIIPEGTPVRELVRIASVSNFQRQWIPPFAKSAWMLKLRDEQGLKDPEIAAAMNLTEREVRYHLNSLERCHDDVLRAYFRGRISLAAAVQLSGLPSAKQSSVLAAILAKKLDRPAQKEAAVAARDAEVRTAFERWRPSPGAGFDLKGGKIGRQTLCIEFAGIGELFDFFVAWVWPRMQREKRTKARKS